MSGRGGGRGGRGGRGGGGGGGGGRGGIGDLSLGTLTFADLLATSRADVGDVLYPTTGVATPATDGPSEHESQAVSGEVDRWLFSGVRPERQRWVIEGDLKARKRTAGGVTKQMSRLGLHSSNSSAPKQDFLYSDRYKVGSGTQDTGTGSGTHDQRFLLDQKFFPHELWTSYVEGKKMVKKRKLNKVNGKPPRLDGLDDDGDGEEKEGEEEEEEVIVEEEEEVDEDDVSGFFSSHALCSPFSQRNLVDCKSC